jgi:hypothetical protein
MTRCWFSKKNEEKKIALDPKRGNAKGVLRGPCLLNNPQAKGR